MADGLVAGALLRGMPAGLLSARDRLAGDRAIRSDLSEPHAPRLPADGAASESALAVAARTALCASDADGRSHRTPLRPRPQRAHLRPPFLSRTSIHHRSGRAAVLPDGERRARARDRK